MNSFDCQGFIAAVNAAFATAMSKEDGQRGYLGHYTRRIPETKIYAHSVKAGRLNKEIDKEEYNKMRMEKPEVIYLEAIRMY